MKQADNRQMVESIV